MSDGERRDDAVERAAERARDRPDEVDEADVRSLVSALGHDRAGIRQSAAVGVASVAEAAPGRVVEQLPALRSHTAADDAVVRSMVAAAFADAAAADPDAVGPAVPDLVARLADDGAARRHALRALARTVTTHPEAVAEAVPTLVSLLDDGAFHDSATRVDAVAVLLELARAGVALPEIARATPTLLGVVEATEPDRPAVSERPDDDVATAIDDAHRDALRQHSSARKAAAMAVATVAAERPGDVEPHVTALASHLADPDVVVRSGAVEALGHVAADHPDAVAAVAEPLAARLSDDEVDVRAGAARALGLVADEHPAAVADAVEPELPAAFDLLDGERAEVKSAAAGLVAYLAEERPGAVQPAVPSLVALLESDAPAARGQATWALGFLDAESAVEPLRDRRRNDPDPELRRLAAETIDRIQRDEGADGSA